MTPSEFKAWFDGFTEAFEGRIPTKAQWSRIKERVAEIDGKPVTERVYLDRYWPYYPLYCTTTSVPVRTWTSTSTGVTGTSAVLFCANTADNNGSAAFNSAQAMGDLGRAEARSLAA